MKKKKLVFMLVVFVITLAANTIKVRAALQSNGDAPTTRNINGWITQIRQMQATGGTLGLTDTITDGSLVSNNPNLDIHMQKNTEYGAMVILSASSYGNPEKVVDGGTTTGNPTGVVMRINKEWVAAGMSNTAATSMANASNRYKNKYAKSYVEKPGDAIGTIGGWHGSTSTSWISSGGDRVDTQIVHSCLLRAYGGSIFSYNGYGQKYSTFNGTFTWYDATKDKSWYSRAAVVVGSGI